MTETTRHKPRVLIVEDDAFIAIDIESVLEAAQFEVADTVCRVSDALDFLERETPDLALLDYNLGDHTSTPIAKRLQEMGIPLMFVSGQKPNVVLKGLCNEDVPFIGKPFCPNDLVTEARAAIST